MYALKNMAVELKIGLEFRTFGEVEKTVSDFSQVNFHAVLINNNISVRTASRKESS